jgi:nitrogenase subunit NifH
MRSTSARFSASAGLVVALAALLIAGCSPQRDATPMPTKQTTIDPVINKLDAAAEREQKRREEMEAAAKQ